MKRMYLVALRRKNHLSQAQIGKKLRMSQGNYNDIETGSRLNMNVSDVQDMAEAFKVSPYWLFAKEMEWLDGKMCCNDES